MKPGEVFFIDDAYWADFGLERSLPCNKSPRNMRPCVFVFADRKDPDIKWFVPISSKLAKYSQLEQKKVNEAYMKGEKPVCRTIRFGRIHGSKCALLVQNLFPATEEYIKGKYVDENGVSVTLSPRSLRDLQRNTWIAMKEVMYAGKNVTFTPIEDLRRELAGDYGKER